MSVSLTSDQDIIDHTGGTSIAFSVTVSGSNPAITIIASIWGDSISSIVLSGGLTGTPARVKLATNGHTNVDTWVVPAPSGSGTLTINTAGTIQGIQCNVALWAGADQTTPCPSGDAVAATDNTGLTSVSVTPTNVVSGDAILFMGAQTDVGDDPNCSTGTQIFYGDNTPVNATAGWISGAGTGTVHWTSSFSGQNSTVIGLRIKQPSGGGSSPTLPQLERKTRGLNRGMYQAA